MTPILELRQATKTYAGVPAIEDVDFALLPGEVHALVGENGAGKSTLTKIMAGDVPIRPGEMLAEGLPAHLRPTREPLREGARNVGQGWCRTGRLRGAT